MKKGIISFVSALAGAAIGAKITQRVEIKEIIKNREYSKKHLMLYQMMARWVRVKQEEKNLASYFAKNGYKKIAIYGMAQAGDILLRELKETSIEVAYGIDQNAEGIYADIDIFTVEDNLLPVDAVVVTAIAYFDEIEEKLKGKIDCPVISLEDVLFEV